MVPDAVTQVHNSDRLTQVYWDEGYVVIPAMVDAGAIEQYKAEARALVVSSQPKEVSQFILRDAHVVKGRVRVDDPEHGMWKLWNMDRYSAAFRQYQYTPQLLNTVGRLIGPDIKALFMMFIYKPPGIRAVHPFHQDAYYLPFGPHEKIV